MLSALASFRGEALHAFRDPRSGLEALVAIHDTRLGPAFGGCRLRRYGDEAAALADVLRLARGMSYKNALAEIPFGGGKAVVLEPQAPYGRAALFERFGAYIDGLGGGYVTAMDAGTTTADMDAIARSTRYVSGASSREGDPSAYTALGVAAVIRALAAREGRTLAGLRVAVQGVGHVGARLCRLLADEGAELLVADADADRVRACVADCSATAVAADRLLETPCDVLAPCAFGSILDHEVVPRLRCRIVAGAANNQLAAPEIGPALAARGIRYAPDYVVNAGGVIHAALAWLGRPAAEIRARVERIASTLEAVVDRAHRDGIDPATAADRLALERLRAGDPGPGCGPSREAAP